MEGASRIWRAAALCLSMMLAVSACGSSSETRVQTQTMGQQLIDLKRAYDAGIISKSEYEAKRKAVLRQ